MDVALGQGHCVKGGGVSRDNRNQSGGNGARTASRSHLPILVRSLLFTRAAMERTSAMITNEGHLHGKLLSCSLRQSQGKMSWCNFSREEAVAIKGERHEGSHIRKRLYSLVLIAP